MNEVLAGSTVGSLLAAITLATLAHADAVAPSPGWARALPPGPDTSVKITEAYARHVARDAFFWAWPLVNVYNKRRGAEQSTELAYAGPVPAAPLNRIVHAHRLCRRRRNGSSPARTRTWSMAAARLASTNRRS